MTSASTRSPIFRHRPRSHRLRSIPRHVWVALSGWASRIVTAVIQLVAVRFLLDSLGIEGYAVFALLTGMQGWFLLVDLGIGASVQNGVSEARALGRSSASTLRAGRLLAVVMLLLSIAVLWVAAPLLGPGILHSFDFLTTTRRDELFLLSGSLSIGIGVGSLVYKVWYAEQRGYLANLLPAAASLLGLLGIAAIARWFDPAHRLEASLAAFLAPNALLPLAVLVGQSIGAERAPLQWSDMLSILRRGIGFWMFAVLAALTLQVDYIVMSQFLDAQDISTYALATKIYALAFFVYNAVLMALWPVLAEMVAAGRWSDVRRQLRRTLGLGLVYMTTCSIALVWLMPEAVRLLAPNQNVSLPIGLIVLLGFYQVIRVWCDTFATLLQATSWLRPFWLLVPGQALLSILLQWWLTPRFGLIGLVAGLCISFLLTVAWGLPLAARMRARRNSNV